MFARGYLILGSLLLAGFGAAVWGGWEPFEARQAIPPAGMAIVASSWYRSSSGGSRWYSSSTRSGGSIFGGK